MSDRSEASDGFEQGSAATERPDFVSDEHLGYLEELRQSGVTNMLGARPYLMNAFPRLTAKEAAAVLAYWMKGGT